MDELLLIWNEKNNNDFSQNLYHKIQKIIEILTKEQRCIYFGLFLILLSFFLFNFQN